MIIGSQLIVIIQFQVMSLTHFRGIGLSTFSTPEKADKFDIESLARDAVALIESFKWPEVDIVALSMGGMFDQK